jgi:hypothetical protein
LAGGKSLFEDYGSTRINLACPHCQQLFKVRLRKLQFGADLICRLCRQEFSAREVSNYPDVQEALARMRNLVKQRVEHVKLRSRQDSIGERDNEKKDNSRAHLTRPVEQRSEAGDGSLVLGSAAQQTGTT